MSKRCEICIIVLPVRGQAGGDSGADADGRWGGLGHVLIKCVRTSNPATFSIRIHSGWFCVATKAGRTTEMRCRKLAARGSASPCASGLRTVYG